MTTDRRELLAFLEEMRRQHPQLAPPTCSELRPAVVLGLLLGGCVVAAIHYLT